MITTLFCSISISHFYRETPVSDNIFSDRKTRITSSDEEEAKGTFVN